MHFCISRPSGLFLLSQGLRNVYICIVDVLQNRLAAFAFAALLIQMYMLNMIKGHPSGSLKNKYSARFQNLKQIPTVIRNIQLSVQYQE